MAVLGFIYAFPAHAEQSMCSYTSYDWNTYTKASVNHRKISHLYSMNQPYEIHQATGCTVCEQDQIEISLPGVSGFKVCKFLAANIKTALSTATKNGAKIFLVTAYRVGMTKGDIDSTGIRTQFSNHSFGIAIDINAEQNGLYDHCIQFGPACRLIRGGAWQPDQVGSLTANSQLVIAFSQIGLKWGGKIQGQQKDFMHFSPNGY